MLCALGNTITYLYYSRFIGLRETILIIPNTSSKKAIETRKAALMMTAKLVGILSDNRNTIMPSRIPIPFGTGIARIPVMTELA